MGSLMALDREEAPASRPATPHGLAVKRGEKSRAEADVALSNETMAMRVARRRFIFDGKVLKETVMLRMMSLQKAEL